MRRKRAAAFHRFITEARTAGLLNDEDVETVRELVEILDRPITCIQDELEEQAGLRASAGYYHQCLKRQAKGVEDALDECWFRIYDSLRSAKYDGLPDVRGKESGGRFSEKLVSAKAATDAKYQAFKRQALTYRYFADQAYELKTAYDHRSRFLEQWSNNSRSQSKLDME